MKKIIIFTCAGGGGHLAAANALEQYLNGQYQVEIVNIFADVLVSFDLISLLSHNRYGYEKFYNSLVRNRYMRTINFLYPIGKFYYWLMQKRMSRVVERYLDAHKPDAVVSVVVLVNGAILDACKAHDIPFLLSTTDLEMDAFLVKINKPAFPLFRINVPFADDEIIKKLTAHGIEKNKVLSIGFPLRTQFFQQYDAAALRKKYHLDGTVPVVLISMGAQGSTGLLHAVDALKELAMPVQLIVTLGKSSHLRDAIEAIVLPPWITCTLVESTVPMAELMAMADIAVIKAGSTTFCEAIQMGCPLLLDQTQTPALWEQFNHKFVKKYGIGSYFKRFNQLPCMVERCILDESYSQKLHKNMAKFKRSDPSGSFIKLNNELCNKAPMNAQAALIADQMGPEVGALR